MIVVENLIQVLCGTRLYANPDSVDNRRCSISICAVLASMCSSAVLFWSCPIFTVTVSVITQWQWGLSVYYMLWHLQYLSHGLSPVNVLPYLCHWYSCSPPCPHHLMPLCFYHCFRHWLPDISFNLFWPLTTILVKLLLNLTVAFHLRIVSLD